MLCLLSASSAETVILIPLIQVQGRKCRIDKFSGLVRHAPDFRYPFELKAFRGVYDAHGIRSEISDLIHYKEEIGPGKPQFALGRKFKAVLRLSYQKTPSVKAEYGAGVDGGCHRDVSVFEFVRIYILDHLYSPSFNIKPPKRFRRSMSLFSK